MDTNSNEGTVTIVYDYHLICDKVKRENVSSQRYSYTDLGIYVLDVVER